MNRLLAILAGLGGPVRHRSQRSRGFALPFWLVSLSIALCLAVCAMASPISPARYRPVLRMSMTAKQADFLNSAVSQVVFCAGRGSGKTYTGCRFALRMVLQYPNTLGLITANTYQQLHKSTLREFVKFLREERQPFVFNKRPKWFESRLEDHKNVFSFPNGAQIVCASLENYDAVRGAEYGWWWGDEVRDTKREAYDVVIACLRDTRGPMLIRLTTTPNGYDWLYEVFQEEPMADPKLRTKRKLIRASTYENRRNLAPGFIDLLESSYDPVVAQQEIYGQFINIGSGTVYSCFNRELHCKAPNVGWDKNSELILGCDFNASPCAWVICQRRMVNGRECLVVIDEVVREYAQPGMSMTESMARLFLDGDDNPRRPRNAYKHHADRVVIYGDYFGHSARSNTTISDWQIVLTTLRNEWPGVPWKVDFRVQKKVEGDDTKGGNPEVIDRVNAVNAKFTDTKRRVSMYVNPRAKWVVRDLERVTWKESGARKREINKTKDPKLTHATDALGYVVVGLSTVTTPLYGTTGNVPDTEHGEVIDEADRILEGAEPGRR